MWLAAQGDSWFDYPFFDVLERLEKVHGFDVESVAHRGETLEGMAYGLGQGQKLARLFDWRASRGSGAPAAILLSGGGNDIAGDELAVLLNHRHSGLPPINEAMVDGLIEGRLRRALFTLVSGVTALCRVHFRHTPPVFLHGYGYAIPDGRGFWGGDGLLPGPWLLPSLRKKGHIDPAQNALVVRSLIDRFNAMVQSIPSMPGMGHVRVLDFRPVLVASNHCEIWNDELHPTQKGFGLVAGLYAQALGAAA
jgi:hypothetical protein